MFEIPEFENEKSVIEKDDHFYVLIKTSFACPEQYDVYWKKHHVGYLRLRHGSFRADFVPTGEVVYSAYTDGDGCFDFEERDYFLNKAINEIHKCVLLTIN